MSDAPAVTTERPSEHVAVVTLDRPPVNALDRETARALREALEASDADESVRAVVLRGAGRHFCAGADIAEEHDVGEAGIGTVLDEIVALLAVIRGHRAPVIAAISGAAAGGGFELAVACDIRLAAEDATFTAAGVNVGLIAGVSSLPRLVGPGRARHLILTGEPCPAGRAERWGLVTGLHPAPDLLDAAVELAEGISSRSPLAVEAAKRTLEATVDAAEREAVAAQQEAFAELFATRDRAEAMGAFLEGRPPRFERR